jgi:hypothetical protein
MPAGGLEAWGDEVLEAAETDTEISLAHREALAQPAASGEENVLPEPPSYEYPQPPGKSEGYLQKAKFAAGVLRSLAQEWDSAAVRNTETFVTEEAMLDTLSAEQRRAYIEQHAPITVELEVDEKGRKTFDRVTVQRGLGTCAWHAGLVQRDRQRFWTRAKSLSYIDMEAAWGQSEWSTHVTGLDLVQNRSDPTTFQDYYAQLAYQGILRGFAVMARLYANDNGLPAEEQQRLLDKFLGRVVYKRPPGQPGE